MIISIYMKKFKFQKFTKKSGSLIPFSLAKDVPFLTKRIFLIYGKKNFTRGDHAHHKCNQFLVPISGKMEVKYENEFKSFSLAPEVQNKVLRTKCLTFIFIILANDDRHFPLAKKVFKVFTTFTLLVRFPCAFPRPRHDRKAQAR